MAIKVGNKGRERLREQIRFHLSQEETSGVPRDGTVVMMCQWIVGLLENVENVDLIEVLEED